MPLGNRLTVEQQSANMEKVNYMWLVYQQCRTRCAKTHVSDVTQNEAKHGNHTKNLGRQIANQPN